MAPRICLRCDWQGDTTEPACPNCGQRPLYLAPGAVPPGQHAVAPHEAGQGVPATVPAASTPGRASRVAEPSPPDPDVAVRSRRARGSVVAAALAAISVIVTVGIVLNADEERASGGVSPASFIPSSPTGPSGIAPEGARAGTRTQTAGDVRFSFDVPSQGWETFDNISINKSIVGPQGAEAIVFWTTFPDGGIAAPCDHVLRLPDDASARDLATAMANAPGIGGVRLASDLRVGGLPTQHVLLTVRARRGCDPGYFFTWRDVPQGALWTRTTTGDTIRVWIVRVRGTLFVIEAATNEQADQQLAREITRIVGSIRFR